MSSSVYDYTKQMKSLQVATRLFAKIKHKYCSIIYMVAMACFASTASANEGSSCTPFKPVTFGILPFISAEQLVDRFFPLANYLSKYLHVPVRIETAPNFVEFARRTHEDKRYDILFTAPHFYPKAKSKGGYQLIASVDSPGMWAVIVAPRKSNIHTVKDLMGKRLATVHRMGLSSLLVRKHLSAHGINPDEDLTMVTTPTHDASLLSSYHGVTYASALMKPPYQSASKQVRESMRIIARTESTPHIPISVGPRINKKCATEMANLLLKMDTTAEGQNVLKHNRFSGFRQAQDKEYDRVRDLLIQ